MGLKLGYISIMTPLGLTFIMLHLITFKMARGLFHEQFS
jgi:hypothetical protein